MLLVRVGIDHSRGGWNAPFSLATGEYVYVPIPERRPARDGVPVYLFDSLVPALCAQGVPLPTSLAGKAIHLDPDFRHLSYGDMQSKARQLAALKAGDALVFYAGFAAPNTTNRQLVYALFGIYRVSAIVRANTIGRSDWDTNAHSRIEPGGDELIVFGDPNRSGRFTRAIPIGDFRNRAYRVREDLLDRWGGISARDGFIQRSARIPEVLDGPAFLAWLEHECKERQIKLVRTNWP